MEKTIQIRRNTLANMPAFLQEGVMYLATDTKEIYIGTALGNELIASSNALDFITMVHPNGIGSSGHKLVWLDQYNAFNADMITLQTDDPTTYKVRILITGSLTVGDVIGFDFAFDGDSHEITYTVQGGDTIEDVAGELETAFKADTDIIARYAATNILNMAFSDTDSFYWNDFYGASAFTVTDITVSATATLTVSGDTATALEFNPYFSVLRSVPGRPAEAGDIIGAFLFIGDSDTSTLSEQYAGLYCKIVDPTAGSELGKLDIVANQRSGISVSKGLVTLDADGAQPIGGDVEGYVNVQGGYKVNNVMYNILPPAWDEQLIDNAAGVNYNGRNMLNSLIIRTGAAVVTDNTATASQIVGATAAAGVGMMIDLQVINKNSGILSIAPAAGITLTGNKSGANFDIPATSSRPFKMAITNVGTPAVTIYG